MESLRYFETSEPARPLTHRHTPEELDIQQRRCEIIEHPFSRYKSYMLRSECRYLQTQMGRPIRTPRRSRGIILKCMLKKQCVKVRTEFDCSRIGLTAVSCEYYNILSYSIKCEEFHDQLNLQYYDSTSRSRRLCTEHEPEHIPSTSRPRCFISYHPQPFFYLPSGCFLRNFLTKILYRYAISPHPHCNLLP